MSEDTQMASIIIGDSTALRIFNQMLEKHEKGTLATKNTVDSFGGDSHAMDSVVAHIAHWRRQAALQAELFAPRGDDAVAGTPLGDALVSAERDADDPDRRVWGDWAPRPRPSVGQLIRWPGGTATSIVSPLGFRHAELQGDEQSVPLELAARLNEEGAYEVRDSEGWQGPVQSHYNSELGAIEWRVQSDDYEDERVLPPTNLEQAVEVVVARDGTASSADGDVLDDYSTGTPQDATPAPDAEQPKAKRSGSSQRARNVAHAGVTRAVPKPGGKGAGKRSAAKKGGR